MEDVMVRTELIVLQVHVRREESVAGTTRCVTWPYVLEDGSLAPV